MKRFVCCVIALILLFAWAAQAEDFDISGLSLPELRALRDRIDARISELDGADVDDVLYLYDAPHETLSQATGGDLKRVDRARALDGTFYERVITQSDTDYLYIEKYELDGAYSRLTGFGFWGYVDPTVASYPEIEIYGDDNLLYSERFYTEDADETLHNIDVDVSGFEYVTLSYRANAQGFYLADMRFTK